MSYPCKLIQDLLPLYHDGVCSGESREIIEEHLTNCAECSEVLEKIRSAESVEIPVEDIRKDQKADSLKKIKRRLLRKQIIIAAAALITAFSLIFFGNMLLLSRELQAINVGELSVKMIDGDLVCRQNRGFPNRMYAKNIQVTGDDGEEKNYLFFSVYETKWDSLFASRKRYSEIVLAYKDKGAQSIERVYYYTGDDTGIELLPGDALQKIIEKSTLLWSKN